MINSIIRKLKCYEIADIGDSDIIELHKYLHDIFTKLTINDNYNGYVIFRHDGCRIIEKHDNEKGIIIYNNILWLPLYYKYDNATVLQIITYMITKYFHFDTKDYIIIPS